MLKKKISEMIQSKSRPVKDCFEIISDSHAVQSKGGEGGNFEGCTNYDGVCPALINCHGFTCSQNNTTLS
jgi:hypothetical protein